MPCGNWHKVSRAIPLKKPLLPLAGDPLILWVVRRVAELGVCDRLVVATDAREIATVVERAGHEAVLTSSEHQSGTERYRNGPKTDVPKTK